MNRTLMQTIRDTCKLWTEHMKTIAAQAGVPDSYRMVLTFLLFHPGASQKEIAKFRNITTASVSKIVKEMQLTGYVKKETDRADQRYVRLYLTEKGKVCAEEIHQRLLQTDEKITELFTQEKEEQMMDLLHELQEIIGEELSEC